MNIKICTSGGTLISVDVLMDKDGKEFNQKKIDAFLEEHSKHGIVTHAFRNSPQTLSYEKHNGEWYANTSEQCCETNYEILQCKLCGTTQDVTNGDFIYAGVAVNKL